MKVPVRAIVLLVAFPSLLAGCGPSPDGDLRRQVAILQAQLAEAHAAAADCRRKVRAEIDVHDMVGSGPGLALENLGGPDNAQSEVDNSGSALQP